MELERLAVALRPRTDWEAVDLGFAMVRTWWRSVYGPWLVLTAPLALLLVGVLGFWGLLALWILLPLGEAAVLSVVSRTVFGDRPQPREVVAQTLADWRRLLGEISWRRIDPARAYHLPVSQLERLGGSERRRRIKGLDSRHSDVPGALTLAFLCFELGLFVALIVSLVLLSPQWLGVDWELLTERAFDGQAPWIARCLWLVGAAVLLLLRPFYIAAGFAIYLNRRTDLEGWDLEIVMRRMARRVHGLRRAMAEGEQGEDEAGHKARPPGLPGDPAASDHARGGSTAAVAVLITTVLLAPLALTEPSLGQQTLRATKGAPVTEDATVSDADTTAPETGPLAPEERQKLGEALSEVMGREELRATEEEEYWQLRSGILPDWGDGERRRSSWWPSLGFGQLLAAVVEGLLWGAGILLLAMVLRELLKNVRPPERRPPPRRPPPSAEQVMGLDVRRESLPEDVAGAAEALWREGRRVEAIGLLYRGALSRLHEQGMELREHFTETDCLRRARQHLRGERVELFASLTSTWQATAYAHRLPGDERALELCGAWRRLFPPTGPTQGPRP